MELVGVEIDTQLLLEYGDILQVILIGVGQVKVPVKQR